MLRAIIKGPRILKGCHQVFRGRTEMDDRHAYLTEDGWRWRWMGEGYPVKDFAAVIRKDEK